MGPVPVWRGPLLALLLAVPVGLLCGGSSALFLWLLDRVTATRLAHEWLVYLLPLAGALLGLFWERYAGAAAGGFGTLLDRLHDGGPPVPERMAPLVLGGTLVTHLFGGSAGREGTAVQMGGSLADTLLHRLGLASDAALRSTVLACGISGGFGAVFGTPLAGAVFGLEVAALYRPRLQALPALLVAALVGDYTCRWLGIIHTDYPHVDAPALFGRGAGLADVGLLGPGLWRWLLFAAAVAGVALAFIELTHFLKRQGARLPRAWMRLALGGVLVVLLWRLAGTNDYLGLGVPGIVRAFGDAALPTEAFALKLVFTSVTVGLGFIGGEVTPLFFVGASLGNVLSRILALPLGLSAAVGLAAVFGAAANAPVALAVMAAELSGWAVFPYALVACVGAFLLTGMRGIYPGQRAWRTKHGRALERPGALREL